MAVASVALAGLYMVKRDSADGRMLMWKVAAEAARDAPPAGVSWDRVAGAYGEAPERYFASGSGSEAEKMVADAPEYVFNEYLQVAVAFGPFAALALHRQGDYTKSNSMLVDLKECSSDPMILNIIGKNWQGLHRPDSAERYFRKAARRCPNRFSGRRLSGWGCLWCIGFCR